MDALKSIEVKQIKVNGIPLHYVEQGSGDTVVLVHGGLSDYRMWEGQMMPFAEKHHVVAYSRRYAYPGRGTDDAVGYTVFPHASDLAALINTLGVGPVHLVGHSYGAYVSLITAIEHPEIIKSLVLAEPPVMSLLKNTTEGKTLYAEYESKVFMPSGLAFDNNDEIMGIKIFLDGVMGTENIYDQFPLEVQQQINENVQELKGLVASKSIFPNFPITTCEDVNKVKAPVLLLNGELSPRFFRVILNELERCLLQKERVLIPHSSHEMEMENTEVFNQAILNFIEKHT